MRMSAKRAALSLVFASACTVDPSGGGFGLGEGGDATGADVGEPPDRSSSSGGSSADSTGTADEDPDDDTGPLFDLGSAGEAPGEEACAAVDLLYVIDNSQSMEDNQQSLVDSFPGFVAAITSELPSVSGFRVGVTTTDRYQGHPDEACRELGALVVATTGEASSEGSCGPYATGKPYMTGADDLGTAFACAAQVGIDGPGQEEPISALRGVLSDALNAPGACNDAFVRDDAVLVIVLITDEDQDPASCCDVYDPELCPNAPSCVGTEGDPADWYAEVIAAKGGNEDAVVVLGLLGIDSGCPAVYDPSDRLVAFTEMFEHGLVGDVCAPTYDAFFVDALAPIVAACEAFPEG